MSLFSRRKRAAETPEPEGTDDAAATDATGTDGAEEATTTGGGPHDVADVPELGPRLDLGALRIPPRAGMQLRLEIEKKSRNVVAVTLALSGSAMQLQVFAAPRSTGIWSELREEISASVSKQGGTSDEVTGPFGRELITRLPVKTPEGQPAHRPARFLGIDGPRWFLRAVLTGRSAVDPAVAAELEAVLADVVVVRGAEARAPRDVLLLHAPGKPTAPRATEQAEPGLDPLRRGPEITEVR
ncbi:DUF3710 domain-containing protein [Georgenia subflava]|uniref:DUF3710 domain-containing protein n=1 Tax=Georgenia subflava TaxID=1622177 RepID=A0A6N7ENX3_9MICO|nr:DUF3710 domain-containing protein [Georgenia subflava]MPV38567.1 DUF3710 domain-containing protein [Georgenia subflava]